EVLRLYPVAPGINRTPLEEISIGGAVVRPGEVIAISIWSLHRNPKFWDDPHAFRPERFRALKINELTGIYLPFSTRPRSCIGRKLAETELERILSRIFSSFRIEVVSTDIVALPSFTLRMSKPLMAKVVAI